MKCALCGSRYQGLTRAKRKKRTDGTRSKNYYYACGGYITATNRDLVDQRLARLKEQKHEIECRFDELECLTASQGQIKDVVSDARQVLSSLEGTLREGLPHEKLLALRQCVESITIDQPDSTATLRIRTVPACGQVEVTEQRVAIRG